MDVGGWLRGLGLGQYEEKFRDNKIDADLLPRLTVDDLKDIGVSVVGDRRRLLDAIAILAGTSPPAEVPAPAMKSAPAQGLRASAERRHITVLFCDLVGSTTISASLDAEDWRNLVTAYLDAASEAVTQMGGHVANKLGDGIMALFGHPIAQENDAERAVRAALAIQRALAELNRKGQASGAPELVARIGLATGAVVADSSGEIFGDAPNIAARVQALAEPGTVLVTARVQRQVAGLFVVEDRGAHALKGVAEPTTLFRIVRASGAGRRSGQRVLTPLVGRDEEVTMLLRRWERARQGDGQFVAIVGEPGLGKSRLIEEFHTRLADTPHTWVEWSSSQLLQNTPLHPIAEWGRQRFGGAEVAPERRLADLESTLAQVKLDPEEYVPLLAPLVDVPLPPERVPTLAPEELRRRQMAAILAWYMAGARTQPVVLAVEDLHWADPSTLDVLRGLAERGGLVPLLVVATTRPEFRPSWGVRSHHVTITLAPLDRAQIRQMVGELAQRHALSRDVIEGVSERTGGVPLFIEEVTRLILERGEQGGAQAIPPTLQQSLAARLDRLGPAREVAMIGAVLGRGFSFSLLRAVAGLDEAPLHQALDKLAEADILLVEGLPPNTDYRFKHALIQDAAYENLLKSRRQALHRRAAETVRDEFPDRADAEPEVLAHHFTQAGLTDAAIEYWGKAGDQALRRSAFQEAIAHLGKAIEMADKAGGGQTAGVSGQRQHLHVAYGNALIATRGYGAPETGEAFARARESAASDQDAPERLAVDYGLWAASFVRGELPSMRTHAAAFLRDVEARPDSPEASVAHRTAGITQWFAGEHNEAREHLERALALFQPGRDDDLAFRFGHDAGVAAMLFLALALWPMGDVGRAVFLVDEAQARIAGHPHIGTHAFGKMHAAMFELMRGDPSRATANAVELARLARERELPMWGAFGAFLEGLAAAESGAPGGGLEDMRRGVDLLREQNVLMFDGLLKIALAEVEAHAGDVDRAVAILDRALATSDRIGHRAFDAKLHRIRGEMLLKRDPGNAAPAEEAYLAAIAIAREQGARGFGLLAALSLAKLYQSTGRPVEAHDVLAPALEGFSPTPEMFEIGEAKALLAGLAETDEMKAAATSRQRRLQLQTSYSRALMWSRGFASEEAKAAFAKAQELAKGVDNTAERFDAYYGLFVGNVLRGELRSARETAETFRREAEKEERMTEAAAARRCLGLACLYQGDLAVARAHFEQALRIFDPERDREAKFRFSMDIGAAATGYLALTNWLLGEAGWAQKLIEEAIARAVESAHAPTLAIAYWLKAMFDAFRDDAEAARRAAESLLEVSRGHGLGLYLAFGALFSAWARARLGDPATGVTEHRQALAAYTGQGNKLFAPLFQGRLAEFEAEGQDAEGALTRIDEALALAQQTGEHWTDAFLHRVRGDILFKADPDIPARAEDAYLTAIAIAREQGARSFALQAALKLAKLYRSTSRPVEAHDALAQALEGFSPTSELPEITEAQALLAALAESDDVKGTIAQRLRRRDLQTSYGQALLWAKGFAAEETMAAFARVGQFVVSDKDAAARIAVYDAQCLRSFMRGEYREAQVIAETLLREADERGPEAGAARRIVGLVRLYQGDLKAAQAILKRELTEFQLGAAGVAAAAGFLALTEWHMGEVDRARRRIEQAVQRANESADAATIGTALFFKIVLESRRDDVAATRLAADALLGLSVKHGVRTYSDEAQVYASWARGRLLDPDVGADELRQALSTYMAQGNRADAPSLHGLLAELEAPARGPESALALIDQGLAIAKETGEHFTDPYLHRLRAELLLKRDPSNPAAAEEAYRNAVAIAKEQGARSYELLVSLSLAKLYQSSARPAETHAALAPALEGFSPTPEMPEIGEALALLSRLA